MLPEALQQGHGQTAGPGNLTRMFSLPGREAYNPAGCHTLGNLPQVLAALSGFWQARRTLCDQVFAAGSAPG